MSARSPTDISACRRGTPRFPRPGGYRIGYPFGRSVDQHGVVQLDSRNGIGGVAPNPRVPKTLEDVLAFAAGIDVELQYAVRYLRGY